MMEAVSDGAITKAKKNRVNKGCEAIGLVSHARSKS
jgi:hypothetical protein